MQVRPPPPQCAACPFKTPRCGSAGPVDAKLVIVGESPNIQDVTKNIPFGGPSGDLLRQHIPEDLFSNALLLNAIACMPPRTKKEKKDPKAVQKAAMCCQKRLHEEIALHPRELVIAFGGAALNSVTGDFNLKITSQRGKVFTSPLASKGVVAAFHPAFLLRGGGSLPQWREDVEYALSLFTGNKYKADTWVEPKEWPLLAEENYEQFLQEAFEAIECGADIETAGFDHIRDAILCLGVCFEPSKVWIITPDWFHRIKHIFADQNLKWIWHNGKFDVKFLRVQHDIEARVDEDTMLMSYSLDETKGIHDLDQVGMDRLKAPNHKHMLDQYLPNKKTSYAVIPKPVLYKYLAFDTSKTLQIKRSIRPLVAKPSPKGENLPALEKQYTKSLIPGSEYLSRIEMNGMLVDTVQRDANNAWYEEQIESAIDEINEIARSIIGKNINPGSWQQVQELLYDGLKLTIKGKRPTSTDEDTLLELPRHPAVMALLNHRKLAKGHGTYVKPLYELISAEGRIHPTFLLHGTVTGRLASRNPNVQNIPRDPKLRGQFIAPQGKILLEADLNQAELRSLACLSGDPELIRIYTTPGASLHDLVRGDLYGFIENWTQAEREEFGLQFKLEPWQFDKLIYAEQKMRAKALNFGIIYGREAFSIAEEFGIAPSEGQRMLDAWFTRFSTAKKFIDQMRDAPAKGQTITTAFGYKKRFGVVSRERLKAMQNEASNFPHQNVASIITLQAGIELEPWLRSKGVLIINTVHDSILMECPNDKVLIDEVETRVVKTLERVPIDWGITRVPFKADVKRGTRWGSLKGE